MIVTERLELVPADPLLLRAALADDLDLLGKLLRASVPDSWPPEYLDHGALQYTLDRVADSPVDAGWWMRFAVRVRPSSERILVGTAGYKGPPSAEATVEIGYSIVREHRRRGYASEATRGLVARAFEDPSVERVLAETLPELAPSIGVLQKCGFRLTGAGSEPGVIRFELTRAEYASGA